jgi:hypothetical protein
MVVNRWDTAALPVLVAMVVDSQLLTRNGVLLRLKALATVLAATRDNFRIICDLRPLHLGVIIVGSACFLGGSRVINLGSAYFLSASVLFVLGSFLLRLGRLHGLHRTFHLKMLFRLQISVFNMVGMVIPSR